jgi:hypothetical protein
MVLTLFYIEGYDQRRNKRNLNISYANCRTTLSRAKDCLRKKLEEIWKKEKKTGSIIWKYENEWDIETLKPVMKNDFKNWSLKNQIGNALFPLASLPYNYARVSIFNTTPKKNGRIAVCIKETKQNRFYFTILIEKWIRKN